jgi:hypothetical protein
MSEAVYELKVYKVIKLKVYKVKNSVTQVLHYLVTLALYVYVASL